MPLLGLPHLLILLAIAALAAGLTRIARRSPVWRTRMPFLLGVILLGNELIWYGFVVRTYGFRFPGGLPLDLCNVMVWLTVVAVFTRRIGIFEVAYYGGLGGSTMALLTPDLGAQLPSYPAVSFFISHGLTVITLCVLAGAPVLRPRPGSLWRVFGILNLYTVAVGAFDWWYGTNYMYLRAKPPNASLLDFFGHWPLYILVADLFGLGVFWLLSLPVRGTRKPTLS